MLEDVPVIQGGGPGRKVGTRDGTGPSPQGFPNVNESDKSVDLMEETQGVHKTSNKSVCAQRKPPCDTSNCGEICAMRAWTTCSKTVKA